MEELKLSVTQEQRKKTIDKILKLVESEFEGVEITALFTKVILQETIKTLEDRCLSATLKNLNK